MRRFVEGADREQSTLFPECLEDWIGEDNPVRVIDVFVDELDLAELGFSGVDPEATGRPSYHPSVLLKSGGALRRAISLDRPSMRASSRRQSPARSSITRTIRGDRTSGGTARPRIQRPARRRAPGWGSPYPSASSKCMAGEFGSSRRSTGGRRFLSPCLRRCRSKPSRCQIVRADVG